MAKRFHSTKILTNKGNEDYIEIYDDSFASTSTEFTVAQYGYKLRPEGDPQNRHQPVTATTLTFDMLIQNATHRQFITDLTAAAEGRFKVKLIRNGALRYAGTVIADIGRYEDLPYPYFFTVQATDLGTLATIDHNNAGTAYDGWETFIEHTIRCLDKTGLPEFAWPTGIMLSTAANWYEDSMTTGAAQDPLALTRCNHRAFYEVESTGHYKWTSTLDVLRQLMGIMGCNLRQSGGRFRIFQIPLYNEATPTVRHYDKDGVYNSNTSSTYTVTAAQTNTGARLAGGQYTWLPPLKEVNVTYKHRNWTNILAGVTMGDGTPYTGPELVAATNPFPLSASLKVQRTLVNSSNPTGSPYFEKYRFQFKVGSYYLKRNLVQILNSVPQYEQPTWTTTASEYYFHFANTGYFPALGGSGQITSTYEFTIPPFPVTGNTQFDCNNAGFVNASGAGVGITLGSAVVVTGYVAVNYNEEPKDTVYNVTNSTSSANSVPFNMTTLIGAGTTENSIGRVQVYNGSTWSDSNIPDGWTIGGTGTEYVLQDLLAREIMAGQATPVKKMVHTVGYTAFEPHQRLSDGTDIWAFLSGEYTAAMDDWQGEWYYIQKDPAAPTSTTPYEIPSSGGINPPVKNNGWVTTPQGPSAPIPSGPNFPDVPGIPGGGDGGGILPDIEGIILGGIAGSQTTTAISPGSVTSISVGETLVENAYVIGQQITVIDPFSGINQNFTVAQTSAAGDTSISVTGYAVNTYAPGSYVVSTGTNTTVLGILPGQGEAQPATASDWWAIYAQWWDVDLTLDPSWPIEAPNVVFETDENAGDGATAGIRFDGAGLKSYKSTSATSTAYIDTAGLFNFMSDPNAGNGSTAGLIIRYDGIQCFKSTSATTTFYLPTNGGWQFRSVPLVGNGSTAGVKITDTAGVQAYKSSSATPTIEIKTDGTMIMNHAGHPTPATGLFYINSGIVHTDTGSGSKVQPNFGHIREFTVIGVATNWATGTKDAFWKITSEYAGYEVWQVGFGVGVTGGSGSGTNTCYCYHSNASGSSITNVLLMTCDSTTPSVSAATNVVSLTAGDYFYFNVNSIRATPAQGLHVELYLRKT